MQIRSYILNYISIIIICILLPGYSYAAPISRKPVTFLYDLQLSEDDSLLLPSDVAASTSHIYVVDGGHHRIVVFNNKGEYQFSFGRYGKGNGELSYPVGIDVASNGDVYIADSGNRRIQVFNSAGKYKRQFKSKSGRYRVRPIDVLVDEKANEVVVTGNETHNVMVFSLKGTLKRQWGGNGVGESEFRYPATLAHLKDGRIAVVDVLNSRVQVFDKKGDYSIQIAKWGVTKGEVFRPKGVAVDKNGLVYISDSYMNVVQVFTDEGEFQYLLDIPESHKLFTPVGMVFDKANHLYITEMRNNRVSVYNVSP